jgi:hypothetical protein
MKLGSLFLEYSTSWVYGYNPETKSFHHFPYNENEVFCVIPIHPGLVTVIMLFMKSRSQFMESSMSWVCGYDPETESFHRFSYNENLMRALNTTSLKCCLPSTDAIVRWEKIDAMPMKVQGCLMQACFIEIHQVLQKKLTELI